MSMFDAAQQLTWSANFAAGMTPTEDASYYNAAGAAARSIKIIVNRQPAATPEEFSEGKVPQLEVIVRNDSTYGISAAEFDKGDRLYFATRVGGASEYHVLPAPSEQSASTLTFRIGK